MSHTPAPWAFIKSPAYGYSTLWNPDTREEIVVPDGQNDADRPEVWMGEELTDANKALIEAAPVLLAALTKIIADINDLAINSKGVAGLHRNGDLADWRSLLSGGRFESWLGSAMDEAEAAIALAKGGVA